MNVDFHKPIVIRNWTTGVVFRAVSALEGLALMATSTRWDTRHTTANVREIDGRPVTFEQ